MLAPNFSAMPDELRRVRRWVCHKRKVPYDPAVLRRKASVLDPSTWGTFTQAQAAYEEGGRDGVGLVLAGDGIVGVDMDHVVNDGVPNPAAMDLLDRIGCQYIEYSPSKTGLHGWGYGPNIGGRRGKMNGVSVELYSNGRYLTMTGHPLKAGPLVELSGFGSVAEELRGSDQHSTYRSAQKLTEDDSSHLPSSSVDLPFSSVGLPSKTLPKDVGERNRALFDLARWLKGTRPEATLDELRVIVQEWHRLAEPVIGTKEFATTWIDFIRGWQKVRIPYGAKLTAVLATIDFGSPLPSDIKALGYGEKGSRLYRICLALQMHEGDEPFFLSARQAGELTGMHFADANKVMSAFVADGILKVVSVGAGNKASRYRLVQSKKSVHKD